MNQRKKPTSSEAVEIGTDLKSNFKQLYVSSNSSLDHNYCKNYSVVNRF